MATAVVHETPAKPKAVKKKPVKKPVAAKGRKAPPTAPARKAKKPVKPTVGPQKMKIGKKIAG